MSSSTLGTVIQRAISDAAFRRQLQTDTAGALRGFDLTADETEALRSGDPTRLTALGIDQRISKAFSFGASFGANSASDLSASSAADLSASSAADLSANESIPLVDPGVGGGDALIAGGDGSPLGPQIEGTQVDTYMSSGDLETAGASGSSDMPGGSASVTADETGHDALGTGQGDGSALGPYVEGTQGDGSALGPEVEGTQVDTHVSSGDFEG